MKWATAIVVLVSLMAGALWWVARLAPETPLSVENARIRMVPGGAPMAGYMLIHNRGDSAIRLISARAEAFETVMIHRSIVENDRARMEHQRGGVVISPGQSVEFRPG
ncbi:MAG: copper chaperone PCu(A)C, partial [Wenzhouxiangellaceae bacterium]